MLKSLHVLVLAILIVVALVACQSDIPPSSTAPLITPVEAGDISSSPLPVSPLPTPLPSPNPGTAIVQGILTLFNPINIAPQEDGIYLVPIDSDADGGVSMVVPAVVPGAALQANVDESNGRFFFVDVSTGLYALVSITDNSQQLSIRELDTGEAVVITVREEDLGQIIDLGMLRLP